MHDVGYINLLHYFAASADIKANEIEILDKLGDIGCIKLLLAVLNYY